MFSSLSDISSYISSAPSLSAPEQVLLECPGDWTVLLSWSIDKRGETQCCRTYTTIITHQPGKLQYVSAVLVVDGAMLV